MAASILIIVFCEANEASFLINKYVYFTIVLCCTPQLNEKQPQSSNNYLLPGLLQIDDVDTIILKR